MLALPYLLASFLVGLLLVQRLFPDTPALVRLAGGYLAGLLLTAWATFLIAFILSPLEDALIIAILVVLAAEIVILVRWWRQLSFSTLKLGALEAILAGLALLFSIWLMDQRLSGDPLTVSLNTWGDFGLHIALARSFSWGSNFPPEYPFFGAEPIRYHFGFDFFAGVLERQGLAIVDAFNIPAALGMTAMIVLVFELGRLLFQKVAAALMACVLLITNGSLAFIYFFEQFDYDVPEALSNLWDHTKYLAVGPYVVDGRTTDIAIFWTLNAFLTQTHLIIAMALVLFVAYGLIQPLRRDEPLGMRRALGLGVLIGLSFWVNGVLYIAAMVFFAALLLVHNRWREALPFLVPAGLIALPQAIWLNNGLDAGGNVSLHTGYLVEGFRFDRLASYWDFLKYWWLNLGFALPLMVLAVLWGSRSDRKLMLAVMAVFVFGNFVQLSRDLGGHNHKVFNLWEILMNFFVAFAFVKLWTVAKRNITLGDFKILASDVNLLVRATIPVLFLFLVLSGIIDFMTIKNDPRFTVFYREETIDWIGDNTPKESLFLTIYGDLYTTPTLAGRRIFLGYEPWVSSAGYEVEPRRAIVNAIYSASSKHEACRLLTENGIDYIQLGPAERSGGRLSINEAMFSQEFEAAYAAELADGRIAYYDVLKSCPQALAVTAE